MKKWLACFVMLGLVCAVAGCPDSGPRLVPAGGTITYKNAPLAGANIVIQYADKSSGTGRSDDKGAFTIVHSNGKPGAVPGTGLKVGVVKMPVEYDAANMKMPEVTGIPTTQPGNPMFDAQKGKIGPDIKAKPAKSELPANLASPETSGITIDIPSDGKTDLKIDIP